MSDRLETLFGHAETAKRKVLAPFVTAGDPNPGWTVNIMHALVAGGADLIELGVPFSDPMADGPVIQAASERAIKRGVSLADVLGMVRAFRQQDDRTPVILMGYMNPVERYGAGRLAPDAAAAGVDGFLLVDCPPGENPVFETALESHGLASIRLVAPTTTEARRAAICRHARGFIYYVSFKGITGADRLVADALEAPVKAIRTHTRLPVLAGFGINDPASAAAVARFTDGVVIGSALVERLTDVPGSQEACEVARAFVASVRESMDNSPP